MRLIDADAIIDYLNERKEVISRTYRVNDEYIRCINDTMNVIEMQTEIESQQSETWRYDKPPIEENVIVSCRDETGDAPYNYTSVGWYFNGLWVVDNAPCFCVIAWKELPKPLT